MNKKENIEQIASSIERIIETRIERQIHNDSIWKENYNACINTLERDIVYYKQLIKDYNESNYSVNRIECEGYLRALEEMLGHFNENKPDNND